jgi:hypothetical protein
MLYLENNPSILDSSTASRSQTWRAEHSRSSLAWFLFTFQPPPSAGSWPISPSTPHNSPGPPPGPAPTPPPNHDVHAPWIFAKEPNKFCTASTNRRDLKIKLACTGITWINLSPPTQAQFEWIGNGLAINSAPSQPSHLHPVSSDQGFLFPRALPFDLANNDDLLFSGR